MRGIKIAIRDRSLFFRESSPRHTNLFWRPYLEIYYTFNKGTRSNSLGGVFALTRSLAEKGRRTTGNRPKERNERRTSWLSVAAEPKLVEIAPLMHRMDEMERNVI